MTVSSSSSSESWRSLTLGLSWGWERARLRGRHHGSGLESLWLILTATLPPISNSLLGISNTLEILNFFFFFSNGMEEKIFEQVHFFKGYKWITGFSDILSNILSLQLQGVVASEVRWSVRFPRATHRYSPQGKMLGFN